MKRTALLAILFALAGCQTSSAPTATVDPAPVLAGQAKKDKAVLTEADAIDKVAPKAKVHTDAQRAAVAAAPASDVTQLASDYEATIDGLTKSNAKLTEERDDARNQTDRTIIIGGYSLAALLVAAGVASLFLMAQLPFLGPMVSYSLMAAGGSVFVMLQAYQWTKAHPWITGVALLFLVAAGALMLANRHHSRK